MDVLSFLNSNAIRDHLKSIGYQCNSLEAAWLIYSCARLSLEEKKAAWLSLIDEMPDCAFPERGGCVGRESLHAFLKEYIRVTDSEIESFFASSPVGTYVYMYSYLYEDGKSWNEEFEFVFPSLEKCMDALREDVEGMDQVFYRGKSGTGLDRYRIRKQLLADPYVYAEIECRGDGGILIYRESGMGKEEDKEILYRSFDGLWFDFPTPFHKGDIVWTPVWDKKSFFVLESLSTWSSSDYIREHGDSSDMRGYGYLVDDNGMVCFESMENYMDLEYYPGTFSSYEKILPVLGRFIKGELSPDVLLCEYRRVLMDAAHQSISYPEGREA